MKRYKRRTMTVERPPVCDRRRSLRYALVMTGRADRMTPIKAGPFTVVVSNISLGALMIHGSFEMGSLVANGDILRLEFAAPISRESLVFRGRVVQKLRTPHNPFGQWSFGVDSAETPEAIRRKLYDPVAGIWDQIPDTED